MCSSLPLVNQNKAYFSGSPYPKNTNFANYQFRSMRGIKFIASQVDLTADSARHNQSSNDKPQCYNYQRVRRSFPITLWVLIIPAGILGWRIGGLGLWLIPLSQVNQNLGPAGQIRN